MRSPVNLVLYSTMAFYPMHWEAFKYICENYSVKGSIITDTPHNIPSVHQQLGWVDPQIEAETLGIDIYWMPEGDRRLKSQWLKQQLKALKPDVIWVQEEPTHYFLFQILRFYWFNSRPRIVTAICENIFHRQPLLKQLARQILWQRLNGVLAVARTSIEGIQSAGLPKNIPALTLVAGNQSPPDNLEPYPLHFSKYPEDFILGFVGRICEEKGWKILLKAITSLPEHFKCIIAGEGEQLPELKDWIVEHSLTHRVFYVGLLPKADLWCFYRVLDCLVVPSLTFPTWKEQFGGVLADAMAMGIPIIASDSGAIPEVVGNAGLIVPEGNVEALKVAIEELSQDLPLRNQLSAIGKQRFNQEFCIPAYAEKIAQGLCLPKKID